MHNITSVSVGLILSAVLTTSWVTGLGLHAEERIITFDPQPVAGALITPVPYHEEQFFRFSGESDGLVIPERETYSGTSWPKNGTAFARLYPAQGALTIRHSLEYPFDLISIDISEYSLFSSETSGPQRIYFTGHLAGGGTVSHTFDIDGVFDGHGPLVDFETIVLPSTFRSLSKVVINGKYAPNWTKPSGFHLDNVRFDVSGVEEPYPETQLPLLYDINWNDLPHKLDEVSAIGGPRSPFSITSGSPMVREALGPLTDRPLDFRIGDGPLYQTRLGPLERIGFEIRKNADRYEIEFDLYQPTFGPDPYADGFSITLYQTSGFATINFVRPGEVRLNVSSSNIPSLQTFQHTESYRLKIIVDRKNGFYEIRKDDSQLILRNIPITGDLTAVSLSHSDSTMGDHIRAIDNFQVRAFGVAGPLKPFGPFLDTSLPFFLQDHVKVGESKTLNLILSNEGDEELVISSVTVPDGPFSMPALTPFSLTPRERRLVPVTFTPTSTGVVTGDVTIVSNDGPSGEVVTITASGVAGAPLLLSTSEVVQTMPANSANFVDVEITNTSNTNKTFSLAFPSRDLAGTPEVGAIIPNDPVFDSQWQHRAPSHGQGGISAGAAWSVETGNPQIVVAVMDSGIDLDHPDLIGNIWFNPGEIPANGVDDDKNGFIDDVNGWNFVENNNNVSDSGGHGTRISGVLGATGNNSLGVAGVAWGVKIIPLRIFQGETGGFVSDAVEAIDYAVEEGIRISNHSWGTTAFSTSLQVSVRDANKAGMLVVAGAGNNSFDTDTNHHEPASIGEENVVSVAALTRTDVLSSYSNFGLRSVDLGAPADDIYSTILGGTYGTTSGTSSATPLVSGVAALLLSQDPNASTEDMRSRILNSTDKISSLQGRVATGGRLNAARALREALIPWLRADPESATIPPGESATVRLHFDTTNVPEGFYSQTIQLSGTNPIVRLPVKLRVAGEAGGPPVILEGPAPELTVLRGNSAELEVLASGTDLSFQWFEGVPGETNNPVGTNSNRLLTDSIQEIGTRSYWVRVSNSNGSVDSGFSTVTTEPRPIEAPVNISASDGLYPDRISISWNPVPFVDSYRVLRGTSWKASLAQEIASGVVLPSYEDHNVLPEKLYFYFVTAVAGSEESTPGGPKTGRTALPSPGTPENIRATDRTAPDSVEITWTAEYASSFEVYRGTSDDFQQASLLGETQGRFWRDNTAELGIPYFYWVRSFNLDGTGNLGGPAVGEAALPLPQKPTNVSATNQTLEEAIRVSWDPATNANGYRIYRSETPYFSGSTIVHETAEEAWLDLSVNPGNDYYYWVTSWNDSWESKNSSSAKGLASFPGTGSPQWFNVSDGTVSNGIAISWEPVKYATGYIIYRGSSREFSSAVVWETTNSTSLIDGGLEGGFRAYYWFRAISPAGEGATVGPVYGRARHADVSSAPSAVVASRSLLGLIELTWGDVENATSYEIFRSETDFFQSSVVVGESMQSEWEDFGATPGVDYYYWVRGKNEDHQGAESSSQSGRSESMQADVTIGLNPGSQKGLGLFSSSGKDQSVKGVSKKLRPVQYHSSSVSSGTVPGVFRILGRKGDRSFSIFYFETTPVFRNVSAAISSIGHSTEILPVGSRAEIMIRVTPSARLKRVSEKRALCKGWITANSSEGPANVDKVRFLSLFGK